MPELPDPPLPSRLRVVHEGIGSGVRPSNPSHPPRRIRGTLRARSVTWCRVPASQPKIAVAGLHVPRQAGARWVNAPKVIALREPARCCSRAPDVIFVGYTDEKKQAEHCAELPDASQPPLGRSSCVDAQAEGIGWPVASFAGVPLRSAPTRRFTHRSRLTQATCPGLGALSLPWRDGERTFLVSAGRLGASSVPPLGLLRGSTLF